MALTISLLAALTFDLFPDRWAAWLAGVGLYQMFYEPYMQSFGGHFWFVSTILQFYLVFPFLKKLQTQISNNGWFFLLVLSISAIWWMLLCWLGKGDLRTWNSCFFAIFMGIWLGHGIGGYAAAVRYTDADAAVRLPSIRVVFLPLGLCFTGLMIFMILKMGPTGRIFNDIPALLGYTSFSLFLYFLSGRMLPFLKQFFLVAERVFLLLYLIHVLVLDGYLRLVSASPYWWQVLLYLPLALLSGWAFEFVSRRWGSLFDARKRQIV